MKHEWKCIGAGNWWSEYQCQNCERKYTTAPDDTHEQEEATDKIERSKCEGKKNDT